MDLNKDPNMRSIATDSRTLQILDEGRTHAERGELRSAILVGYHANGSLYLAGASMDFRDVVFLLNLALRHILNLVTSPRPQVQVSEVPQKIANA